ncbi:tRNA pseudouridine(38-40) synthase TruA [Leptospira kmetyi]|uniref:tRNA pseudouridine synthase A n=1 Tax=Leptospira kmetyi TaxID=408139 RepID=A0A2M9XVK3_9LEPT|nr:tRNA pseudouridine(38-40) synthase TruA [Leptospira kmetyi]AYV57157.1 tRNA pseudouridine(38-40) synthase TruA [Leptospira kmetyi]PJZ31875.1 tRNA pseudouridine(38-40) synthase TruA [Leptospira kmetyi]PJZ43176.1 tRNA pseudouridine(38-40) synthase TruA [Leptospira kmetyi]TGK21480.1 tRNA pseudouridine(38-40) synthase TruA [Leptospira kmetyi]TGK28407.1 tRNA pseudouridine(38-40) synthase TruA [Leptospira kmetyi]
MNYALLVEYDGLCFNGFQTQKGFPSVQENLEKAAKILLQEKIAVVGAGRTDTGVHARGMIVNFKTTKVVDNFGKFLLGMNAITDGGVAILSMTEVAENFDSRFTCTSREYEYLILNTKYPRPTWKNRAFWYQHKIDVPRLEAELELLKGEHDFRSLAKVASMKNRSTVRTILDTGLERSAEFDGLLKVRIRANGFLHNMIRILTGTLLEIANGKRQDTNVLDILSSKDRTIAGITLPPQGLYFIRAYYDSNPGIDSMYALRDFQ